jgi:hypothetical protein
MWIKLKDKSEILVSSITYECECTCMGCGKTIKKGKPHFNSFSSSSEIADAEFCSVAHLRAAANAQI